ncbi:MAG TPA: XdhC/CoxI family protein [Desulfobacteraceae bacterium]|nr:XdhC/CoxI family protein [Desulfobacteraceae bacterium]HPJ68363.1 XdhC/CoxI family protein [Desulfobacteraceae bacterium]HPQ28971.1 XdhC/CoxI family protein [Desulfobacteraceae bacterium]
MDDFYLKLLKLIKNGHILVLATIISQEGSSPRGVGTKCLIVDDGSLVGSVGGGIFEAYTIQEAKKVFETGLPVRVSFSMDGSDAAVNDMICGGHAEIFLELISTDNQAYMSIFQEIVNIKGADETGLLATVIDIDKWQNNELQKVFIKKNGEITGDLSLADVYQNALVNNAGKLLQSGKAMIFELFEDQKDRVEIFVEPIGMRPFLYIFGCGHISREITPLASHMGFNVIVIDDRSEFADPINFPDAIEVRMLDFSGVMSNITVDESSYLIIATRGHMHDMTVLEQALKTNAKYIGMVGSSHKAKIIYEKLLKTDFTKKDINRVYSPIGIDIGAETPAEIAVSIVAELVMVRSGKKSNAVSMRLSCKSDNEIS